jgi:hypothetical protein
VSTVVCAIDRSETPGMALADAGLDTLPVFTRADLDATRLT